MIKISLSEDFVKDVKVQDIYNTLARKIFQKASHLGIKLEYTYGAISGRLSNEKEIKSFLLAKDFYLYKMNRNNKELATCFSYNKLTDDNRHYLLTKMDVPVCPYCNMNYTLSYQYTKNMKRTTADLDHFYVKSKHPVYALCLYNFVPACSVCNSRLKGAIDMRQETHIFPHENSFEGKAHFEIENLISAQTQQVQPYITLNFDGDTTKQAMRSDEVFKTALIYQNHQATAREMLEKAVIYNQSYLQEIERDVETLLGETIDLKTLIFGKPLLEKEFLTTSLGKFKMDILKQMGVY